MPRRDGTGPSGAGALSGRGMGRCLPAADTSKKEDWKRGYTPAHLYFGGGRCSTRQNQACETPYSMGRCRRFGNRYFFDVNNQAVQTTEALKKRKELLSREIERIDEQLFKLS